MATVPVCTAGPNDYLRQILIGINEIVDSGGGGASGAVNITAIDGTATSVNCGVADDGTLRVAQATDCPVTVTGAVIIESIFPGTAATNLGKAEDSPHTSGDVGVMALGVANVAQAARAADSDYIPLSTDLAGNQMVVGNLASDSVDAGNPVKIGFIAMTTHPTAVASLDRVNGMSDKFGRQVVQNALRENRGNQYTQISASTAETTIVTADATNMRDLYGLIIGNSSATATSVTIRDSTAGTTRMIISIPANETRGFMLPSCDGHKQAAINTAWTAQSSVSVAALNITALVTNNPS